MKPSLFASVAVAASLAAAAASALPPLNMVWFAGGGGSSEGLAAAGYPPHYALNHNATALLMHEANHPDCIHLQADAFAASPFNIEPGRPIGTFWASPDCKHFSKARGKAPVSPRIRGLAWSVIPWAKIRKPWVIFLENVEEFQDWGPLHPEGHPRAGYPIAERKGETFRRFVRRLEQCGYTVEWKLLRANRYRTGTTRRRLYLIARCDGQPIVWPKPTNGPGLEPFVPFADLAEWNVPTHSIFLTPAEAKAVGVKRPLVVATDARIFKGLERFVIGAAKPFLMHLTHHGAERIHDIEGQLPTVTSANRGEMAIVAPTLVGTAHGDGRPRAGVRAWPVDGSLRAVKATNDAGIVAPLLVPSYGERDGQAPRAGSVEDSYPAVVPNGNGGRLVAAYLGRQFGSTVSGRSLEDSAPTIMSEGGGGKAQIVAAHLTRQFTRSTGSPADAPVGAGTGRAKTGLVAVNLTSYYNTGIGSDAGEPMRSATGEDRHAITAAWLEQANTGMVGHDARESVSAIVGKGCTQRLIDVRLTAIGAAPGTRRRQVLEFLWRHCGEPTEADWANPSGTLQARLRFGLVIIAGAVWEIADIGMRMLTVRELFNAQGFPRTYIIDRGPRGEKITGTAATLMAGNSVCPPVAEALAAANCNWAPVDAERVAA